MGWVTASANAVATAASTALPPSHRTSAPTCEAMKCWVTTMPLRARAGTDAAEAVSDDQASAAKARSSSGSDADGHGTRFLRMSEKATIAG